MFQILALIHLTNPNFSANLAAESVACLVVAAVFKTVEAQFGLGGFNSFPLRHFSAKISFGCSYRNDEISCLSFPRFGELRSV